MNDNLTKLLFNKWLFRCVLSLYQGWYPTQRFSYVFRPSHMRKVIAWVRLQSGLKILRLAFFQLVEMAWGKKYLAHLKHLVTFLTFWRNFFENFYIINIFSISFSHLFTKKQSKNSCFTFCRIICRTNSLSYTFV